MMDEIDREFNDLCNEVAAKAFSRGIPVRLPLTSAEVAELIAERRSRVWAEFLRSRRET